MPQHSKPSLDCNLSIAAKPPKVVDLFAGAGGFSLGAIMAGSEIILAVEFDKHAAHTYRNNFCQNSKTTLYTDNILTLEPDILAQKHFPNNLECDLLLGGPPCQGFSVHRLKNSGINDPRNALIWKYFDFVSALRPKAFLMENVPGLLQPIHANYLKQFYQRAADEKYSVFAPVILDARDFGIPQRRKRLFIMGVRQEFNHPDLNWPPKSTHSPPNDKTTKHNWISCNAAFHPASFDDKNNIHMKHGNELINAFKNTPPNGGSRNDSGRTLPCHKTHNGHKDVYGRIDSRLPAPTMTTGCLNPSKGRFIHPTEHHGITGRQAARIQTFPDNFVFEGGITAMGKQIGNAVPVQMAKVLITHILTEILTLP